MNNVDQLQVGVSQYQAKQYEEAKSTFNQIIDSEPENAGALTNLALVEYQLGNSALSVALLRKASQIDPTLETTQEALRFILPQVNKKEVSHNLLAWEGFREQILSAAKLETFLLLTSVLALVSGWMLLSYWGQRRNSLHFEKPLPRYPLVGIILSIFFMGFLFFSIAKQIDIMTPRATIIVNSLEVKSLTDESAPTIFELYGGMEVVIERVQNQWAQVTYPGGMTGWVLQKSLLQTHGENLW